MLKLVAKGVCVNPGTVVGRSRIINGVDDLEKIEYGDIVVLPRSDPQYALALYKASAVICEIGGKLSHLCIVSMEMGIPCITQTSCARELIPDETMIYMDAMNGEISIYIDDNHIE